MTGNTLFALQVASESLSCKSLLMKCISTKTIYLQYIQLLIYTESPKINFNYAGLQLARAPIVMFVNIYAGELPIRKTCNFDKPLNHIFKVMDGCMHIFCLVSIKTHIIRMLELQLSPFCTDSLH